MVDTWIQNAQYWLNNKYANVQGFVPAPTDGVPSWPMMWSLTRALQHELGISSLSDNFGPTTLSTLAAKFNSVSATTSNVNIRAIVQCALWCKGYPGDLYAGQWGTWDSTTTDSIAKVRSQMGLSPASTVFPKLFKSLLTLDAYVLIGSGTALTRSIQQSLNGRYFSRADFFLIPCDGLFSRDVQRGLMLALQYEIGMVDGVANGEFGPGTRAGLSTTAANVSQGSTDSSKYFVHLFQAALAFNSYSTGAYDGTYSAAMTSKVKTFQAFTMLPQTGKADLKTWASLLVSTGDSERTAADGAKAADCITTITNSNAQTLIANGYTTVGRYLSNTYDDPNDGLSPIDKNIKPGELSTIFANGLKVFPIFQEGEQLVQNFNRARGRAASYRAHTFATTHGFKTGTVIYFAVDFDALEEEVYSNVVPFFEGVKDGIEQMGNKYSVGIYGARNTCSIVSAKQLAKFSFVSGMSTGYSGNLGFPLPSNWAFDQIKEYTIGTSSGEIGIDKDIMSNKDLGQSAVTATALNQDAFTYLDKLQAGAVSFMAGSVPASIPKDTPPSVLVLQYLRAPQYNDQNILWASVAGRLYSDFVTWVDTVLKLPRISVFTDPQDMRGLGFAHLAVAANGVTFAGLPTVASGVVNVADLAGWAGDLVQTMTNWDVWGRVVAAPGTPTTLSPSAFVAQYVGMFDELESRNQYAWGGLLQDVDGVNIGYQLWKNPSLSFASLFRTYYGPASSAGWRSRFSAFKQLRFGSNATVAKSIANAALLQAPSVDRGYADGRGAIVIFQGSNELRVSDVEKAAMGNAYLDLIVAKGVGH